MTDFRPFDLRPLLARGVDPLHVVVERAQAVAMGGRLVLDAPFNPLPLRRVLAQMGFSSRADRLGESHWRIALARDGEGRVEGGPTDEDCHGLPDLGAPVRRSGDGIDIDLRGLQPPAPMLAILRLCATIADDTAVTAHVDRDPIYLYPELAEIGWTVLSVAQDAGDVQVRLRRGGN